MYDNVLKVLVVDDDEDDYVLIRDLLAEIGPDRFDTTWAAAYGEALRAIESHDPEVCLIDYRLGEYNGVELLRETRARGLKLPAILLTAQDDHDVDLKAMRAGAADYLIKGQIDKHLLERSIRYAVEHARTLEALRASENKYRQIIETAREGVWTVDPDARTTYVNQRMAEMLGYTVEEMLGRPTVDFMDADDVAESQRRFGRRRRGIAEQYECRLRRRDGTELRVLVSTNPLYGPGGEFAGALGMVSDITERKRAEEENRKLLAELAERVKELTALHGVARLLQREWSDTATILGRFAELLPPAFHHAERAAARVRLGAVEAATPGFAPSPASLRADFTTADGQASSVEVVYTAAPAHGDDGPFLAEERALLVTAADMLRTAYDRWRAEAALRESEERFRQLAENVRQVFWIRTPDIGEILYVSPAYESVWGLTRESLFSSPRSFIEAIHAEDRARVTRVMEDGRHGHEVEYRIVRPDGSQRWVWDRGFPVRDESGQVYRVAGIAEDITERKQAEERLRHQLDFTAAITASMGEGVYALDEDGRLTFMNPAAEAALGWTEAELLGRRVHEVIHFQRADGVPRPAHDCPLLGVLTSGQTCRGEDDVFTRRDGTLLPVSYTAAPILTGGRVIGTVLAFRDITERKRAEEERERLAAIVESSDDTILSKDLDGRITSWNAGAERMYGYAAAEAVGRHISFIIPPDRREELSGLMERIARGERVRQLETVRVRKDGRRIEVSLSIAPMKDGGGRVVGASTIARDITERKATERELRESEERYRDLVENARDIIYTHDLEGNYMSVNSAGEQLLGYTREEARGMSWLQVVAPEYRERVSEMIARKLAGKSKTVYELEVVAKDGRRLAVEVNSRLTYRDGVAVGVQGIARDVTERRRAEELLRAADRRAVEEYERLLDRLASLALSFGTARDLVTIYRGLRDFSLSLTPSFALVICLYDEARAAREAVYFYMNGEELAIPASATVPVRSGPAGRAVKTGTVVVSNDYLKDLRDREPVLVGFEEDSAPPQSALIAPMTIMGRTIGTIEVQSHELGAYTREHATAMQMAANLAANAVENVRLLNLEREKAEQLRQSQKMEAVGQLAGGIAHDFNNLLTAITGYSELSLRRLQAEAPLHRNIMEIKKAGERAASLTRQLLAFSRKQVLQPKVLALNSIISDVEKMLCRLIGEDIELRTVLEPQLGSVKADPGQIEQVLLNLAVNARDAMPHGGKLTIETANVRLDGEYAEQHIAVKPGHYVMLAVSDTGVGMDEKTQARIFEPFFTTKEAGKGTGLGLSTVYGIVKQSGGNIWVYSEVGRGTTFKVYLPRVDEGAQEYKRSAEPEEAIQGTGVILLAEDEQMVRKLAREVLEMCGYKVLEAANGGAALLICERHQESIDLLVTDVVMPEMGGRELATRLSQLRPEMKVLYMSGYTDNAIVHQGVLDEGANFIQKPFPPQTLASKVREVLGETKRDDCLASPL